MEANNVKAVREALETLLNLAYEVQEANGECGPKTSVPAQFIIDVAKSALAAPPRNCDGFSTAGEADAAYRSFYEREIAMIPMDAVDLSREMAKIPTKDTWLFAPAAERKGESDER